MPDPSPHASPADNVTARRTLPKGPGLTDRDYQILAAIKLLEANGYKVLPVKKRGKP